MLGQWQITNLQIYKWYNYKDEIKFKMYLLDIRGTLYMNSCIIYLHLMSVIHNNKRVNVVITILYCYSSFYTIPIIINFNTFLVEHRFFKIISLFIILFVCIYR